MIRNYFGKRTNAPQPLLIMLGLIWIVVLICLHDGSRPTFAWCAVGGAVLVTVYVAASFRAYLRARKPR
jgi:hypothetical protein